MDLENYFTKFRENISGTEHSYESPYGYQEIIYADWIASGRLYKPIEEKIQKQLGPFVANTHTETSETGTRMTHMYHHAKEIIKKHVNAGADDILITAGFGMTAVINKFQRILGLKGCGELIRTQCLREMEKPVVFISHMEHHSNHTAWYATIADVVVIEPDENLYISLENLEKKLEEYKDRTLKIGSFTACSNVTGIETPYHKMAALMHKYKGFCFVDFAASAPYVDINMHPQNPEEKLDAIFFSPHKFLGGPGSSGVLIFDSKMYQRKIPDHPGGGTVDWTNPWGKFKFIDNIEAREDGGTPGFLQTYKTAMSIRLKEEMNPEYIRKREEELLDIIFKKMDKIEGIHILADNIRERLGVVSFYSENIHYNLFVKLLSDRYGIQVRGGCACAGTYGHFLLEVTQEQSDEITDLINHGDLSRKPGWVRLSIHPTMTNAEVEFILNAIEEITLNIDKWQEDYEYNSKVNEFFHKSYRSDFDLNEWFEL